MTSPTMTDLDRAIVAAREALSASAITDRHYQITDALCDLLAAIDAARGEAVAWIDMEPDGTITSAPRLYSDGSGAEVPLYAAPPAAAVPASDPPVMELIGKYWDLGFTEGKTGVNQADAADEVLRQIRRALSHQPAAAVPDGYALVPVEPTQGMLDAAGMSIVPAGKEWLDQSNRETWAAMLAAANKENNNG